MGSKKTRKSSRKFQNKKVRKIRGNSKKYRANKTTKRRKKIKTKMRGGSYTYRIGNWANTHSRRAAGLAPERYIEDEKIWIFDLSFNKWCIGQVSESSIDEKINIFYRTDNKDYEVEERKRGGEAFPSGVSKTVEGVDTRDNKILLKYNRNKSTKDQEKEIKEMFGCMCPETHPYCSSSGWCKTSRTGDPPWTGCGSRIGGSCKHNRDWWYADTIFEEEPVYGLSRNSRPR